MSRAIPKPDALAAAAFFAVVSTFWPSSARGAPCCSGNSAAPALISGDERAQAGFAIAESHLVGDAPDRGPAVFRSRDESEMTRTYRLDAATLVGDRWQTGATIPFVEHHLRQGSTRESGTAFGDVRASGAYEILPEWSYRSWRPRGHAFVQVSAPTGRSIYQESQGDLSRTSGRGFWNFAIGSAFTKSRGAYDFAAIPEVHRSLAREFRRLDGSRLKVREGFGASLLLGIGYSVGDFRVGLRVQPIAAEGREVTFASGERARAGTQTTVDTGVDASYLLDEDRSIVASYTDQTLFGPARNASLSRSGAIQYLQRWQR